MLRAGPALCLLMCLKSVRCEPLAGKDNGLGSAYVWAGSLESGLQLARQHRKPLMLIIHKSSCGACQRLKPKFASSPEIQTLSHHFVMVNLMDDDEPPGKRFAPDGSYIPRILFLSPRGDIDEEIFNEAGSDAHRYFYSRPEHIAAAMTRLLDKYGRSGDSGFAS